LCDAWRLFLRDYGPGLSELQEELVFDEGRRGGRLIGCQDRLLPRRIAEFDAYIQQTLPTLEDNDVVQDLLYNGPKAPFFLPQFVLDWINRPLLRWQRSVVAETLPSGLAERFRLPRSETTAKHARRLGGFSHLLGYVPALLRRSPLALFAMWRTARDPRIRPEPIHYP
jgi:uncharacterized protein (DUF2236 family)